MEGAVIYTQLRAVTTFQILLFHIHSIEDAELDLQMFALWFGVQTTFYNKRISLLDHCPFQNKYLYAGVLSHSRLSFRYRCSDIFEEPFGDASHLGTYIFGIYYYFKATEQNGVLFAFL